MPILTEVTTPTLISEGSHIQGSVSFRSAAEMFGLVEGDLEQQAVEPLRVGRTGWVKGAIRSKGPVIIEGRVDGDIYSESRIRLLPTAMVSGALHSPSVDIRAGARIDGELKMGKAEPHLRAVPSRSAA